MRGKGTVVMTRALPQAVTRTIETEQRGQDDVGGERGGIGRGLVKAEGAGDQRRLISPLIAHSIDPANSSAVTAAMQAAAGSPLL